MTKKSVNTTNDTTNVESKSCVVKTTTSNTDKVVVIKTAASKRKGKTKKKKAKKATPKKKTVESKKLSKSEESAAKPVVVSRNKRRKTKVSLAANTNAKVSTTKADTVTKNNSTTNNSSTIVGVPPPQMWASHTTHQFATKQLDNTYKFLREKLVTLMTTIYKETDPDTIDRNVVAVLGSKPIKIKKIKDPNAPKRPKNGYMLFCNDFVNSGVQKTTDLVRLSREQSRCWKELNTDKKQTYLDKAELLKQTYLDELKSYNERTAVVMQIVV